MPSIIKINERNGSKSSRVVNKLLLGLRAQVANVLQVCYIRLIS
jgi:hypothetical protein